MRGDLTVAEVEESIVSDSRPSVVIATPGGSAATLERVLGGGFRVVATATMLEEVPALLEEHRPKVLVVSRYLPGAQDFLSAVPGIRQAAPQGRIVVLVGSPDGELGRLTQICAMYGIYNLVLGDEEGNIKRPDLMDAVTRDRNWSDVAAFMPEGFALAPAPVAPAPAEPTIVVAPHEVAPATKLSKVVVVGSGKGGVGKTTVVANILVSAASAGAVGVDMDYQQPDLAGRFFPEDRGSLNLRDLLQVLNLNDANANLTRDDVNRVEDWVQSLPDTFINGVSVIPGPSRDYNAARVPRAVSSEILASAAKRGRLVVVDTAFDIADAATIDALERADEILVVTTGEYSSIYEAGWYLNRIEHALHVPAGKIRVVLNKAGLKGTKSASEVSDMLEHEVAFSLKFDPRFESAHVSRRPLSLRDKKGPVPVYVASLLKETSGRAARKTSSTRAERPRSRTGLLARLRGR